MRATNGKVPLDSRILVVDDDATSRTTIQVILRAKGFSEVRTAVDGPDALTQIADWPPDLVVLDIVMPGIDGFEVCSKLRADPRFAELPILVLTGLDNPDDRAKVFKCGATDVVSKPIDPRELMARVSIHLENRLLIQGLTDYRSRTEDELSLACAMQQDLLPSATEIDAVRRRYAVDLAGFVRPCSEVGGDLWGMREFDDATFGFYAADFSGHGVGAALNTFRIQALIAELRPLALRPSLLLESLNSRLCDMLGVGQFATMFCAMVDVANGRIDYAAAGAPSPALIGGAGTVPSLLNASGLPLGISKEKRYPSREAHFPKGSSLFFVSDAFLEQAGRDAAAPAEERFLSVAADAAERPDASAAIEFVVADFMAHQIGPSEDDLTVICLRR